MDPIIISPMPTNDSSPTYMSKALSSVNQFGAKTFKNIKGPLVTFLSMYLFWTFLHWGSSNAYSYHCTPMTFIGFILTPLMIQSPQCKVLYWVKNRSLDTLGTLCIAAVMWLSSCFTRKQTTDTGIIPETDTDRQELNKDRPIRRSGRTKQHDN